MHYARTIYYNLIMYTAGRIIRKGFSRLIDKLLYQFTYYLAFLQFAKTVNYVISARSVTNEISWGALDNAFNTAMQKKIFCTWKSIKHASYDNHSLFIFCYTEYPNKQINWVYIFTRNLSYIGTFLSVSNVVEFQGAGLGRLRTINSKLKCAIEASSKWGQNI